MADVETDGQTHWRRWHEAYADPGSSLSHRLRLVRAEVTAFLDERAPDPVRVLSLCAGDGRDLMGALVGRSDTARVSGTLVELDPVLAEVGRRAATAYRGIEVRTGDAGDPAGYAGLPPADLVLLCGVFGNISDEDVHHTVSVLPALCAPWARVIWTRSRRDPDLTPRIRGWFADSGFAERAFRPVSAGSAAVGVADLVRVTGGGLGERPLFTFALV